MRENGAFTLADGFAITLLDADGNITVDSDQTREQIALFQLIPHTGLGGVGPAAA